MSNGDDRDPVSHGTCTSWAVDGICYGRGCKFAHNLGDKSLVGINDWYNIEVAQVPKREQPCRDYLTKRHAYTCKIGECEYSHELKLGDEVMALWRSSLRDYERKPEPEATSVPTTSATTSNASASNCTERQSSVYSSREFIFNPNEPLPPPYVPYTPTPCSATTAEDLCNAYGDSVKRFTWDEVRKMTNDLTSIQLGQGAFGKVYLGKLSNSKKVAVKVLDESSKQGIPEFVNEVNLLKGLNHENLVRLLGYCQDLKKVLVYEFAEEGTLWDHLHGGRSRLDWRLRLRIALQSACGLEYLHTGCNPTIFHRDIKSENILITKGMIAKVADFGISKVGSDQDHIRRTHVTTRVIGTLGYLDPEYHMTGQLSSKSDVFSFGVLLLEIVTGRKPLQDSIFAWIKKHKGKAVVDPDIKGQFNPKAMKQVLSIAKRCVQVSGADRPEMKKVVRVLEDAQIAEDEKKSTWSWFST